MANLRERLLAEAALLPPDAPTPDSLLFGEGFDPSDTYILAIVNVPRIKEEDDAQA